ncbi:MAG: exosortase/archaeosortase family protein [bacterium]|nr:exosortase/archaeosortase family protein [bacterium]
MQLSDRVVHRWIRDPNWSHGWLVPLFSIYFLSTQRDALMRVQLRTNVLGLVLLLASMVMYFGFMLLIQMSYPQVLSIVVAIMGLTLFLGGWELLRITWFPIAFVALAIPLPDRIYFEVTMPLRVLASDVAAGLLSLIPELDAQRSGVTIDYIFRGKQGRPLNVEEACSGMRLMMAFVTLGLAMAYLGKRPGWQRVVMVLACIPIAVFCNIVRVTVTGCIHVFDIRSLASGTPHALLGLAMLPIALGLFALVGYVLKNLFVEVHEGT